MYFQHSTDIRADYPELVAGTVAAEGIDGGAVVEASVARLAGRARARLADGSEAEFPEIQAWRRTFTRMGLKPTQYRCASESLLRRFKREDALPRIHPLIDLCNAVSLAYAIPVAVFDLAMVTEFLEVRYADGDETYLTFSGEVEHPREGEVIFADGRRRAHARRWTNRQSGLSAVRDGTSAVLVVAEAMHASAGEDVPRLLAELERELRAGWPGVSAEAALLSASAHDKVTTRTAFCPPSGT